MRLEDGSSSSVELLEPSATMNDLPSEVMKNIFSFVGKGNYCFIAPVSKDFCYNYLTMDVIEDKFAHKMDCQLAIGRNKITTAEAASSCFELAEHCFFKAPEDFQKELVREAIRKGKVDIVEMGEAMGIDVKESIRLGGMYFLRDVVKTDNLEMLKFLIEKGVNIELRLRMNIIAETAASHGQLAILKWLYRNKFITVANFSLQRTMLKAAAKCGNLAIVEWGLDIARFNFLTSFNFLNEPLLNNAAKSGNVELVKYLKSKEMPWNEHTFCDAAASGNIALLQYLLENGCPHETPKLCANVIERNDQEKVVGLLQWLHERGIHWDESCCEAAARAGNLKALKYVRSSGCPWNENSLARAVQYRHFEVVEYCLANGCPLGTDDICRFAMSDDNHDLDCKLLKLLRGYSAPWSEKTTSTAIHNENFEALKWCVSHGCPWHKGVLDVKKVARVGTIELMKWMKDQGCVFNEETCAGAADGGNLEVLRWLRKEGCSWDEHTFYDAVVSEELDTIQFCIDNDFPWDEKLYVAAIGNVIDPMNIIKLLRNGGYPWHPSACSGAAEANDLRLLRWLKFNGCPWDEEVCHEAVKGDNVEILKYAHENGCAWSKETYALCLSPEGLEGEYEQIPSKHRCSDEMVEYLNVHNCPRPDPSDWRIFGDNGDNGDNWDY